MLKDLKVLASGGMNAVLGYKSNSTILSLIHVFLG